MLNRTISITEEQWDKVEATMVKYNLNFNEAVRKIIDEYKIPKSLYVANSVKGEMGRGGD